MVSQRLKTGFLVRYHRSQSVLVSWIRSVPTFSVLLGFLFPYQYTFVGTSFLPVPIFELFVGVFSNMDEPGYLILSMFPGPLSSTSAQRPWHSHKEDPGAAHHCPCPPLEVCSAFTGLFLCNLRLRLSQGAVPGARAEDSRSS